MNKQFWIIIGVIAALFIGILYFNGHKDTSKSQGTASVSNHVKGNLGSKVALVEYGDFQCPVCGAYYPIVTQVFDKYKDKIKFQFRNLPLSQVHQHAFAASRAAEAASEQGKFWEMYDALYANQTTWSQSGAPTSSFKQYATQIGLDGKKYDQAFTSDNVNRIINADINEFKKTGDAMATPTFYLNGKKLDLSSLSSGGDTAAAVAKFSALIDAELKAKGQQ